MPVTIVDTKPRVKPVGPGAVRSRVSDSTFTYSAVPHAVLRDRRLLPVDVLLVGVLLAYARDKATCWPSVRSLMAEIGKSRRTVQMSLRRLKAAGWVAEEPADNATGRVLVLAWRRGAQPVASQGRNAIAPPPAQSVAPEWKNQREEKVLSLSGGEGEKQQSIGTMTEADRLAFFSEAGWLNRPPGDLLRRLAERRIASALGAPASQPLTPTTRPRYRSSRGPRRLLS